jgi:hypothetical protein
MGLFPSIYGTFQVTFIVNIYLINELNFLDISVFTPLFASLAALLSVLFNMEKNSYETNNLLKNFKKMICKQLESGIMAF